MPGGFCNSVYQPRAEVNRARRRQQEEQLRRDAVRSRFRLVFFVFAGLALVALVADTRSISRKLHERTASRTTARRGDAADIAAGLHDARYVDPAGLFSLVPPRNWVKVDKPLDGFFNVAFQGPYGMDMGIQVAVTNGLTFNGLIEKLQQRERALSAEVSEALNPGGTSHGSGVRESVASHRCPLCPGRTGRERDRANQRQSRGGHRGWLPGSSRGPGRQVFVFRFLFGPKRMLAGLARGFPSDVPENTRFVSLRAEPQ